MLSLIIRKILSSSAYALSFTLGKLINKLEYYKNDGLVIDNVSDFCEDVELTEIEEYEDDDSEDIPDSCEYVDYSVDGEIKELRYCQDLAQNIRTETKAVKLIDALGVAFERIAKLGGNRKALIFTESRKTQEYLKNFLQEHGYRDKVVCFNGENNDFTSKCIYENWLNRHHGTPRISGNREIDKKQAIVDYFKSDADILIATEAGAEGINLQFCSLVVNYDMPWNPQRIEQRIGRCHRYGQKHDVVVVNFVNESNEADKRVYELLDSKFNLFEGVFGCSDEVLGALDSSVGFERKLNLIYQKCRTAAEIEAAFDELQKELEEEIAERMKRTHRSLLENFDEEVLQKLKLREKIDGDRVNAYNRTLWLLATSVLSDKITNVDDAKMTFDLLMSPSDSIPVGKYVISKDCGEANQLRLMSPLGEYIVSEALKSNRETLALHFNQEVLPYRKSLLVDRKGTSGIAHVHIVKSWNEHDSQENLICCCVTDDGEILPDDFVKALLQVPPQEYCSAVIDESLSMYDELERRVEKLQEELSEKTNEYVIFEIDKIEAWEEDMIYKLEEEVINLRHEHEAIKRQIRKERIANIKLQLKEREAILARELRAKQQELFEKQDECSRHADELTKKLRNSMQNQTSVEHLFSFKWSLI